MADQHDPKSPVDASGGADSFDEPAAGGRAGPTLREALRQHWQVPAMGLAAVLLIAGVVTAFATKPKPEYGGELDAAKALLDKREFARALDQLNSKVLPDIAKGRLSPGQRREFHLMRARALYLGQREAGIDRTENNENIVGEYAEAEKLHAEPTPKDVFFIGQSLISLGRLDEALSRAEGIVKPDSQLRIDLIKRMVELSMEPGDRRNSARALDLLSRLTADTELSNEQRLWALGRQARLLVEQGYAEDAVVKVLRAMPRLEQVSGEPMAETLIALANGYAATGSQDDAAKQLERVTGMLSPDHPLMAEVTLLQAQLDHDRNELPRARERYMQVADRFGHTTQIIPALLGLGEVESQLANQGDESAGAGVNVDELRSSSVERYAELVERLKKGERHRDVAPARVGDSLQSRCREQIDRRDDRTALRYGDLAEELYTRQNAPPTLLKMLATAHRRLADDALREAGKGGVLSLAQADPATRREAREHLLKSGDYSREHAERAVLIGNGEDRDSLWAAADAFDRAGDLDASLAAFKLFAETFPSDLRVPESRYRLARAHQARGDLDLAGKLFRELSQDPKAGEYADKSRVPLAQTLLSDADPGNDAEAERLLVSAVSGSFGGPETEIYRAALLALGRRYFETGRFALAVQSLDEYLQRVAPEASDRATTVHAGEESPGHSQTGRAEADHGQAEHAPVAHGSASIGEDRAHASDADHGDTDGASRRREPMDLSDATAVRYVLADAHRRLAAEMATALRGTMPDGERREMTELRAGHLTAASALYDDVRAAIEKERHRTAIRDLYLRNSYLFLGDCAFDAGDFAAAIKHYDAAKERYPRDPAALSAMTQIVAALLQQGKTAEAIVANTRAKRFYESLPEAVWDDPALPMTRQAWQRWIDSQATLASGLAADSTKSERAVGDAGTPTNGGRE